MRWAVVSGGGRRHLAVRLEQQAGLGPWRRRRCFAGCFSTNSGYYVAGLTEETVQHNDAVREYMQANFPNHASDPWTGNVTAKVQEMWQAELVAAQEAEKAKKEEEEAEQLPAATHLNISPMKSYRRVVTGTRACNRLRNNLLIPGTIYGRCGLAPGEKEQEILIQTPWSFLQREVDRFGRGWTGRVYDLTLFNNDKDEEPIETIRVTPRDVQRHPTRGFFKMYCVNFLRYATGRVLELPIRFINEEESPALKRGGFIAPRSRVVPVVMESDDIPIPLFIELDCAGLEPKTVLRLDRLTFPPGVKPSLQEPEKFLMGTVYGRGYATVEVEAKEE